MKAIKRMFALPVVAMLLAGSFSACSQDEDLFEYDLGNDDVATLAKRSMPRNGEVVIIPPESEDDPSRQYFGVNVPFEYILGTGYGRVRYNGLNVTVVFSFIPLNNKPTDVKFEYYYEPQPDFSIEGISLDKGVLQGHYILTCDGLDNFYNTEYIGSTEILL